MPELSPETMNYQPLICSCGHRLEVHSITPQGACSIQGCRCRTFEVVQGVD